jgi:16S rRNA (guanine966-N2)-methyltransferase
LLQLIGNSSGNGRFSLVHSFYEVLKLAAGVILSSIPFIEAKQMNQLRIIAGKWRGRKIHFADEPGVRPTLDRVRETAFNWLQGEMAGARCLDAFAGSGALGIEALSRGAKWVTFVDQSMGVIRTIDRELATLDCDHFLAKHASFPEALTHLSKEPFDIVFLDPPYNSTLLSESLSALKRQHAVHDNTLYYIELPSDAKLELPKGLNVLKHKTTKRIQYMLVGV